MKKILFLLALMSSQIGFAAEKGAAQIARFQPWMETIKLSLESSTDISEVADTLLAGENRIAAFNLQALGRLYSNEDKQFIEIRKTFKKMEDAIGEYDKWVKVLNDAIEKGKSKPTITKLETRVKEARRAFEAFLESEKWVVNNGNSRLSAIQKSLNSYHWNHYEEDRRRVLQVVEQQLTKLDQTDFDVTVLESGNGLHELRREMRWFLIEARVLNGLLTFDKSVDQVKSCPITDFEELVKDKSLANGKYSKLPLAKTETNPCFISQCLFLELVNSVGVLGDIKDKAERLNNVSGETTSDDVPEELIEEAQATLFELKETRVFSVLAEQIKTCQ